MKENLLKIWPVIRFGLIAYGSLAAYGWLGSDRQIFLPPPSSYTESPEILKLTTVGGIQIAALYLNNPEADRTLLYSHGNAEDIGDNRRRLEQFQAQGFAVLAYDYPGYGLSEGKPSEQGAYQAIDAAYHYLIDNLETDPQTIILLGRSVGGGPAIDLAAREPVGGLIIESSFVSAFRVVTQIRLLPFDKFANLAKIPQIASPVLVIHGTEDTVIPLWHGEALLEAIESPKQALWVEGAGHNNVLKVAGDQYWQTIQDFVN